MNLFEARQILELSGEYSDSDIKKNYRKLILEYHPDKCKDSDAKDKFVKINQAYTFITGSGNGSGNGNNGSRNSNQKNIFFSDEILNLFNNLKKFNTNINTIHRIPKKILITPKEYFTGTKKNGSCNCDSILCTNCAGCGYEINLDYCGNCAAQGWIKNCINTKCNVINIPGNIDLSELFLKEYKIEINDPKYTFKNNNVYYKFDISLKESLIGFDKIFIDPFGTKHSVNIGVIIKKNDGYSLNILGGKMILLFNILYPDKISTENVELLKGINF